MDKSLIRNFSIVAHIDHGKSTLADRILEYTHAISKREFKAQLLDDMDLERERGITIKASAVRLNYTAKDGNKYILNLIDTPGHVDFSYEVRKSIAACEGALLVVDAAQGVEAQTVANLYLAMEHNLSIVPVINKIDLSNADIEGTKSQMVNVLGLKDKDIILVSAKEGRGTEEILEAAVRRIAPPEGDSANALQALIFDSNFDSYQGVVIYIRVFNGCIRRGMKVKMMSNNREYEAQKLGVFTPKQVEVDELSCGEVGYIICNIREAKEVVNGDTITDAASPAHQPLAGYKEMQPMVYCGIYPTASKDFAALRQAMEKLKLNDASFVYEPEDSSSLGFGFRCGFLGLLHMEITQERLEREYDLNLVTTSPSVIYRVTKTDGSVEEIDNPSKMPDKVKIAKMDEPFIRVFLIVPSDALGSIMELARMRRGAYKSTEYLGPERAKLVYEFPLSEVIADFYDRIKSITRGYGSMDYEFLGYRESKITRLDILINGKPCDAFSSMVHRDKAYAKARALCEKLKGLIPRQLIEVVIQASADGKIIARESVRPLKKNVTGKCYGGDITRKRKLWEKQKAGKKRMKRFGTVEIPQEAFLAALRLG